MKRILTAVLILSAGLFSPAAADEWSTTARLNIPRAGAAAVTYNGKIYVFGGKSVNNNVLNSVEVYDPLNETWSITEVASFKYARYNATAIVWKDKIYLIGGRSNNKVMEKMEVYDPAQNMWSKAHEMHNEREGHSANILNDHIYVFGGRKSSDYVDDIEWYDAENSEWEEADTDMEDHSRAAHFNAVYENTYYMFGGYFYGGPTNTIYKLSPDSSNAAWTDIGRLDTPRAYGATAAIDSFIFLIGGETNSGKSTLVEIFNTGNGQLSRGKDMSTARSGMAVALLENKIFIIGGYTGSSNDIVDDVDIYTPDITAIVEYPRPGPQTFRLARAYPNPFNGRIRMDFEIPLSGTVQIDILNSMGQKIRRLENSFFRPGSYSLFWDARDNRGRFVASGAYFVLIRTREQHQILKITYVK